MMDTENAVGDKSLEQEIKWGFGREKQLAIVRFIHFWSSYATCEVLWEVWGGEI